MKKATLNGIVVGPVQTNCYFVKNTKTQETIIIDPGAEPERIIYALDKIQGKPVAILLTHGHYDHMCAANELRSHYQMPIYAAKEEEYLLLDSMANLSSGWSGKAYTVKADQYLFDEETITLAGFCIKTICTPGHTIGSCCYFIEEEGICLSGDTLFYGSCGRTDLPTGSMVKMRESLKKLLDMLPKETEVYPGHGEATDVAFERQHNPYL